MTIENRVTRLEKHVSTMTATFAARIIAARAHTYRHTSTAELVAQQDVAPSNALARVIRARMRVGVR